MSLDLKKLEQPARLARIHLLAQAVVLELFVADDVDAADLGKIALINLEHHVDPVLVELDDLGLDPRREAALPAIQFENSLDVRADRRAGEDLTRGKLDLGQDLVVLEPLVPLEDDAVDDRILADLDDEVAGARPGDRHVREQLGRVEILERLVERPGGVGLARGEIGIGADRLRLEPLVAAHRDRADRTRRRSGCFGRGRRRLGGGLSGLSGLLLGERGRGPAPEHRSDQESGACTPIEAVRL